MTRTARTIRTVATGAFLALLIYPATPTFASEAITRVGGQVVDIDGKPMAKVAIHFDGVDINKKLRPLKTNKKGNYFYATLDISIVRKWKVYPEIPGYKVVKVDYEIIESTGDKRADAEMILGSTQEFPELPFALVGDAGRNVVNFVVAKEKDFVAAVRAAKKERAEHEGGEAATETAEAEVPAEAEETPAEPAAEKQVSRDAVKSLEKAKQLTDAGRHSEAIELYNAYLVKDPTGNPAVYYYLGKSEFESGDVGAAERAFRKALELKPDMKGAHFYLGTLALQEDNAEAAIVEFEQELKSSPDSDAVLYNLGHAYALTGDQARALTAFERTVELNPDKSEAYMQMAAIYEEQNDTARSEEMYQKVIAVDPANASISFYNIGVHAWNENRNKDAAQAFRKSIEINPDYAPSHRELARALMGLGDFAGALEHFQTYLQLNPGATDAKEIRESIALLQK